MAFQNLLIGWYHVHVIKTANSTITLLKSEGIAWSWRKFMVNKTVSFRLLCLKSNVNFFHKKKDKIGFLLIYFCSYFPLHSLALSGFWISVDIIDCFHSSWSTIGVKETLIQWHSFQVAAARKSSMTLDLWYQQRSWFLLQNCRDPLTDF